MSLPTTGQGHPLEVTTLESVVTREEQISEIPVLRSLLPLVPGLQLEHVNHIPPHTHCELTIEPYVFV